MIVDTPQVGRGCTSFRWVNMLVFAKPKKQVCMLRTSFIRMFRTTSRAQNTDFESALRTELQTIYSRRKLSGRPR